MNYAFLILSRFLLFFIIPYLELVSLRFIISREAIYEHMIILFSPGLMFYALIPFATAFVVFVMLLDKRKDPLPLIFHKKIAIANGICFIIFLLVSLNLGSLHALLGKKGLSFIWADLGVLTLGSSLIIFLDLAALVHRIKKYAWEALFGLFAGSLFYLFHLSIHYLWPFLSTAVTFIVYTLLNLMGLGMTMGTDQYTLSHPLFSAKVAAACSGLEGIFLFIFLFSLILIVDWGSYTLKKALLIYCLGILFMFFLNVLRVTIFFTAAIWATQQWGQGEASQLFVWFFHANVGWVFYLIGIAIFFSILFRIMQPKPRIAS